MLGLLGYWRRTHGWMGCDSGVVQQYCVYSTLGSKETFHGSAVRRLGFVGLHVFLRN